ncbi:MAG TPA: ROK family protein, partial [Myxococcaceae bacterium]|nr:ROK family protein [Myxococcaceae bacterium]
PDSLIDRIRAEVESLAARAGRPLSAIQAIGVAVPGRVDEQSTVLDAGKLVGWTQLPLRDRLAARFGVPAFVEQDANAAALGERWRGGAQQLRDFVFLALGTGVGAGVVVNGRLVRGARCAAGEMGDLMLDRSRLDRGSPEEHNLGALVGGPVIRERARQALGEQVSTSESLTRANEEPKLRPLVSEVTDYVAMAVIAVSAILDPQAIFLGGGTASAGEPLLQGVRNRLERALRVTPDIRLSSLEENAQLYGAVFGALRLLGRAW